MMRTTINLENALLREVKTVAANSGRTLTAVLEDALREFLARRKQPSRRGAICLTTVDGQGVRPGVDLDDTAALIDLMNEQR